MITHNALNKDDSMKTLTQESEFSGNSAQAEWSNFMVIHLLILQLLISSPISSR